MHVGELCIRHVVVAPRETSVWEAAKLMRHHHVGDIVVTAPVNGHRAPVGIVTDRDIVIEVLAPDLDAKTLTVGDIMGPELTTVKEDEGIFETIQAMRANAVRRAPVVDGNGVLVGIVSVDDMVELLAQELGDLAKLINREQKEEMETRP